MTIMKPNLMMNGGNGFCVRFPCNPGLLAIYRLALPPSESPFDLLQEAHDTCRHFRQY